ncbi:MAG: thiamine pyrophosphate-dependent enzyme [Candidatus Goldbacteria bacterium]|nr:thiamine pyrophosphate-dependent enzyme [Candidatus Goldiibacteriota bacterium]
MQKERFAYKRPRALTDTVFSYCPGCGHSTVHKLIAEIVDELGIREKTIGVAPVGCAVFAYDFFDFDVTEAAHGRAAAVATAIKRVNPDNIVFSYQGDGDLASIGMAETIHTANRGENITVIFINNTNYGMTGGQLAPTTLIEQVTTTSPYGRDIKTYGYPIKVLELLAPLQGVKYLERVKVTDAASVIKAKKAIKKAFINQITNIGFSMVEVLCSCPTNWRKEPVESNKWIDETISEYFKIGLIKDTQ